MIRVCVLCEGATEKEFVQSCLYPVLLELGIFVRAEDLGGDIKPQKIARYVRKNYDSHDFITTLLDFYGFKSHSASDKVSLERELIQASNDLFDNVDPAHKFFPYVQMYEFEGLLFSDVSQFEWVLPDDWEVKAYKQTLEGIVSQFANPEEINNSKDTAPSKRIERIFEGQYDKVQHGVLIAESIGLQTIREQCPNFNEWLTWLESLGNE